MTKKLEKLTPEQEVIMEQVRDEWLDFALGGDISMDEPKMREGINWIYELAGLKRPKVILTVDSPYVAQLAANYMKGIEELCKGTSSASTSSALTKKTTVDMTPQVRMVMDQFFTQMQSEIKSELNIDTAGGFFNRLQDFMKGRKLECFDFGYVGIGWDAGWVSFYDVFTRLGLIDHEQFNKYKDLLKTGVWDCILLEDVAIVCRRPGEIKRDAENRLHNLHGPSVKWADGYNSYHLHGMRVEGEWIENPDTIDSKQVLSEQNIELRRALITIMGYERFLKQLSPKVLDTDVDGGGCPRRLLEVAQEGDENLMLVEVSDPSTNRQYHLRVPPNVTTCHEAVAWTYSRTKDNYNPLVEA